MMTRRPDFLHRSDHRVIAADRSPCPQQLDQLGDIEPWRRARLTAICTGLFRYVFA